MCSADQSVWSFHQCKAHNCSANNKHSGLTTAQNINEVSLGPLGPCITGGTGYPAPPGSSSTAHESWGLIGVQQWLLIVRALLPLLLQAQAGGKGGHKAVPGERRIRREITYTTGALCLLTSLFARDVRLLTSGSAWIAAALRQSCRCW